MTRKIINKLSRIDVVPIHNRIAEVILPAAGDKFTYKEGHSDQTIAEAYTRETSRPCSHRAVASIRRDYFGMLVNDPPQRTIPTLEIVARVEAIERSLQSLREKLGSWE